MAVPSCCQPKLHDQRLWEQSLLEEQLRPKANACVVELALCLLCTEKKIKTISQIYELSFFFLFLLLSLGMSVDVEVTKGLQGPEQKAGQVTSGEANLSPKPHTLTHSLTLSSLSLPYTRHSSSISLTALLSLSIYFFKEWPPQIHSHPLRLFTKQPERSFQNTDVITSPIILVVPKVDIRILHTTYPYRPHVASPRDPT